MGKRNTAWMPRPRRHPGRKALAYHEAGHAVVGYAIGYQLERVSIVPTQSSLGHCLYANWDEEAAAAAPETALLLVLAGAVAEEIVTGAPSRAADERRALGLMLGRCPGDAAAADRVTAAREHLTQFLAIHWPAVKALAAALRKQRELNGPQAAAILNRAFRKMGMSGRQPAFASGGSAKADR